jgi:signal transduction histidine kinase
MNRFGDKWYRRLQVQLWLWSILPLTLMLTALALTGVYGHQRSMRDFVSDRDMTIAYLYAQQIEDGLAHGWFTPSGGGLEQVVRQTSVGRRGVIYVVDAAGRALFDARPGLIGSDLTWNPAVRQAIGSASGSVAGAFLDGTPTLASFATVAGSEWRVVVEEPVSDVIVPILRFSSILPAVIIAAGVLSVLIMYFSLRTIVRPLQQLSDAASDISWGDFSGLELEVGGVEEIRHLRRALLGMVNRIRVYQRSMQDYIAAIMHGQEAERARLSRELHDETVQDLIATVQRLQLAQRALERDDPQAALEMLRKTRGLCDGTLQELRRLIRALRPIYLEDLGLLPAIEMMVQELRNSGLRVETVFRGQPRRLSLEVELAAYRVAQEALANAAQHANAQQITLTADFSEQEMVLSVEDDGVGFVPPGTPDIMTQMGHFGLVGMQERVLLVGGSLEIDSGVGQGTRVTARFPLATA